LQVEWPLRACCYSTTTRQRGFIGSRKRAGSTLTSGHGLSAAIASSLKACVVVNKVDDQIVLNKLSDPSDLDQFTRQVAAWLRP
jgi:hypothetical protein